MNREQVQTEALIIAKSNSRCGLAISMGVGKTRIAIRHLDYINDGSDVLVVVPKHSIKKSWIEELEKLNLTNLLDSITFTTYLSLNKQDPTKYSMVYLDECHNLLYSHRVFLDEYKGGILGLTGTPPVRASEKLDMVNEYCPIKYEFTVDDAANNNILNDYRIIVHMLDLNTQKTLEKKRKDGHVWYTSEVNDYNYLTSRVESANSPKEKHFRYIMRMRGLMGYKTKEDYTIKLMNAITDKVIVFANTQEQADYISPYSYHSKNMRSEDNLESFSDGTITKLSCVLQLSEGISIPNLKQGIIMHSYGNERKSAQRIGRLLRLNPDDTATCHILCYRGTVDETWVNRALESFDKNKIKYYDGKN